MSKRIAILGSTGSIGTSALQVIEHLGPPYTVSALSAHRQADKLIEQARKHRPAAVAVTDNAACEKVERALAGSGTRIYRGASGLVEMVRRDDVDVVLAAIVGAAGLPAVFAAVELGKGLALANKEALVVAGSLLVAEARKHDVRILPVDSEHSAIFQAMHCGRLADVRRIILTASGGPFRTRSATQIANATLDDALNHPTWRMGNKITIDSATLFNKGLELIEACWLFGVPADRIQVVIHPQSIIHSMVEFADGSVIAQLSPPDMRTPIQYALTYPQRTDGLAKRLDIARSFDLHFEPPDFERFPALRIAYDVAQRGGTLGAVMNAANEIAVAAFCAGQLPFGEISRIVELTIAEHSAAAVESLQQLLDVDRWAREHAKSLLERVLQRK